MTESTLVILQACFISGKAAPVGEVIELDLEKPNEARLAMELALAGRVRTLNKTTAAEFRKEYRAMFSEAEWKLLPVIHRPAKEICSRLHLSRGQVDRIGAEIRRKLAAPSCAAVARIHERWGGEDFLV